MKLVKIAASQLGIQEISGPVDNPQVVKYATETNIPGIDNDEIPWCSTFVNWCAMKAELAMSGKANARSWLKVGKRVNAPIPGDVVVFWRESRQSWKGHVGIFMGYNADASKVFCLGGNQGNAVTIVAYDAAKVLGFRRLEQVGQLIPPTSTLKRGDKNAQVIELQKILNHLNYNCGDVDGDFGKKTQNALKDLQADNMLVVNGEYDHATKAIIESLLQA